MKLLRLIGDELWGLFVDDGVFAGAIVLWLLVGWGVLPHVGLSRLDHLAWLPAVLLFAGLAVILVFGALRAARRTPRAPQPKA
jgi:hypothetical protein